MTGRKRQPPTAKGVFGNGSPLKRVLVCILAADLILAILLGALLLRGGEEEPLPATMDERAQFLGAAGETVEERIEAVDQYIGRALAKTKLRSETEAENGELLISFHNDARNTCSVSLQVLLMPEGRVIAEMGRVDPGWHVERIRLNEELEPGEYRCIARCSFYTGAENMFLGTAARQMKLTVK